MSHNPKSASNRLAALWKEQGKKVDRPVEDVSPDALPATPSIDASANKEPSADQASSEAGSRNVGPRPVPSREMPVTRPSIDPPAEKRKIASASSFPDSSLQTLTNEDLPGFREFERRWSPVLRQGQLKVCEVLYRHTVAQNRSDFETSLSRLGTEVGLQVRQIRNILGQLQMMGFIDRQEIIVNQRSLGTRIKLFLDPIQ